MKNLLSILIVLIAPFVWAADRSVPAQAAAPSVFTGEVLEVQDIESYTYLRLKTRNGETWAAVGRAPVKKGTTITIEDAMVVNNFESRSLKKTFPTIIFGSLAGTNPHAAIAKSADAPVAPVAAVMPDAKVAKASGPNAKTVAEIITQAASLKDKTVLVRGKVVKYNAGILGRNWIHLRDGSGSAAERNNDVLITSLNAVKVGDVVTAKGIVRTDKDFGSGYVYKVIVEEASFQEK